MSVGSVKVTRRELYKQVWSEPMTKLIVDIISR